MVACYNSAECALKDCVTCPRYDEQYKSDTSSRTRRNNSKGTVKQNATKGSATTITVK